MRKWTKSACVVTAWCILPILAAAGSQGPGQSAQAPISIAISTQPALASAPASLTSFTTAPATPTAPTAPAAAPVSGSVSGRTPAGHSEPVQIPPTASTGPKSARGTASSGVLPRWLQDLLLGAALLTVIAFLAEPAVALGRRRRQARRAAVSIVRASHERLVVTYSVRDNTVYLLAPSAEDPRAMLRAARLVLPEDAYQELAGYLGLPSAWPLE
jgi:hypothetical protein